MIVSELIEWLKTMPQDAVVQVLEHYSDSGWSAQGGWCEVVDFTTELNGTNYDSAYYLYGKHFEYDTVDGIKYLTLGVKDK